MQAHLRKRRLSKQQTSRVHARRATPNGLYSACGWIGSQRYEKSTQQKDCSLLVGNENKPAIAGIFIGWLYLLPVQSWTHDNW
jgi:hypothetical protein